MAGEEMPELYFFLLNDSQKQILELKILTKTKNEA